MGLGVETTRELMITVPDCLMPSLSFSITLEYGVVHLTSTTRSIFPDNDISICRGSYGNIACTTCSITERNSSTLWETIAVQSCEDCNILAVFPYQSMLFSPDEGGICYERRIVGDNNISVLLDTFR